MLFLYNVIFNNNYKDDHDIYLFNIIEQIGESLRMTYYQNVVK